MLLSSILLFVVSSLEDEEAAATTRSDVFLLTTNVVRRDFVSRLDDSAKNNASEPGIFHRNNKTMQTIISVCILACVFSILLSLTHK